MEESNPKKQRAEKRPPRELGLKRFWSAVRSSNSSSSSQCEQGYVCGGDTSSADETKQPPNCSLPLLQVWPSSDSPRGEADGQSFVFPGCHDDETASQHSGNYYYENNNHHHLNLHNNNDSGIESIQVSPCPAVCTSTSPIPSPTPSVRRPSSSNALLHPDHARLFRAYQAALSTSSPDQTSIEDVSEPNHLQSPSSSTTSSLTSVAAASSIGLGAATHAAAMTTTSSRNSSDPCDSRRRSSTMTARYSLFDALDLEYALLRAAARGSVGPYSLSESLHKLTFTQSLAFPALARGLANKRRRSQQQQQQSSNRPLDASESGLNAFAKVVTALVLVLVSVLVFAVVYKFVRT